LEIARFAGIWFKNRAFAIRVPASREDPALPRRGSSARDPCVLQLLGQQNKARVPFGHS
jgi:hypothetical protein